MRVVSIGDLVLDYYYKNEKLLGVNGGMTSHNIIANLAKMGLNTSVYGSCGNDIQGEMAINSLKKVNVDTSNIKKIEDKRTRAFHVSYFEDKEGLSFTSKKRCPFCGKKRWYDDSLIDTDYIIKDIKNDDILVFDNLNNKNQFIIDSVCNKKIIDLGQYFEFENLEAKDIINKMKNKFEIINFNERVLNYLIKRLGLKNDLDLFKSLSPKFMTITRGDCGATFIYDGKIYDFVLINKGIVTDSTGAGDAFISSIIKDFVKNNLQYDPNLFEKWYENSNKLTSKVVSKMGARGHINSLFKIKKESDKCTCDSFIYNERKKVKRCNINISNLEVRVINALKSKAYSELEKIKFENIDNGLFIGTGGSFAAAYFSSKIINDIYGTNTVASFPRNMKYRNNLKVQMAFLFSYSGTTNDIFESTKEISQDKKIIITKGEKQNIVLKTGINKSNIVSYRSSSNKGRERGFLSFEGTISPAALFLKFYFEKKKVAKDVCHFIKDSMNYWNNYFEELFKNKKDMLKEFFAKGNIINIFTGDYTLSASFDLESKITESGIINCIIHEKKNFSHGRFINYEHLSKKMNIYFKQNDISDYEEKLIKYLDNEYLITIESRYNGILCEFDLLVASQYLIYHLSNFLNIDISKPSYSEDSMKIYFYKGDL